MPTQSMGDKGLSIFTFAAYHQLSSGETVSEVVLRDGAGHAADPQGVREIETLGLATVDGTKAVFTDAGLEFMEQVLTAIRGTAKHAERNTAVA